MKKVRVLSTEEQKEEKSGLTSVLREPNVGWGGVGGGGVRSATFVLSNCDYFMNKELCLYYSDQRFCWRGVQKERIRQVFFYKEKTKILDSDSAGIY